jgi:hypothetical protein
MGQFSWTCALCDQEVMHGKQEGYQWTTDAVILWPNGDRRTGRYEDGYGVIAGVDLVEQHGGWKLVHQRCLAKAGDLEEMFAKPALHASDQGWWPGERIALKRYGAPNFEELKKDKSYFCRLCLRTWDAKWSAGVCPFGCERPKHFEIDPKDLVNPEMSNWFNEESGAELVEPFRSGRVTIGDDWDYAAYDGLGVCRNEREERPDWEAYHANREAFPDGPPTKIVPCYRFGDRQQIRVTPVKSYSGCEEDDEPKLVPVTPKCQGCSGTDLEILTLTPAEAPNICEFCGHESEDGCHECEVHWCGGCRMEHACAGERSPDASER